MKALFRNLVWEAALSVLHENPQYPVTNIRHEFMKVAFRSTANGDTISIDFAADRVVSDVYLAFTNATAAHVWLFDASDDLLYDAEIPMDTLALSFAAVSGVRSAMIVMTSATLLYVGSVGIGAAEDLPDPNNSWSPGFIDNSLQSASSDGQVLTNKIPALAQYQFDFVVDSYAEFLRVRALVLDIERPIFIDMFDGRRDLIPALYGLMAMSNQPRREGSVCRFTLTITEAR